VASSQEVTPSGFIPPPIPMAADLGRSMTTQILAKAEGRQRERRSADENKYCEVESPAVGAAPRTLEKRSTALHRIRCRRPDDLKARPRCCAT
jgi:hypothetical protein